MRRALILISALLAAAALGALAASGFAGGEPGTEELAIGAERELGPLEVKRVADPGAAATAVARGRGGGGGQLAFFQTPEPLEIAAHSEEGATLSCPKGYRALGGYYVSGRAGTFLGLTAPEIALPPAGGGSADAPPSKRNWVIAVFNTTDAADQVDFGVACLRKR